MNVNVSNEVFCALLQMNKECFLLFSRLTC